MPGAKALFRVGGLFLSTFSIDLRGSEESQALEQVTNSPGNSARPI
jgi:hypothetical protein